MSFDYYDYLDTSFDCQLEEIGLKWLPWIGRDFSKSQPKVIILGESMKDWKPEDKSTIEKINTNKKLIRGIIGKYAIGNTKHNLKHARGLERAIFNKKTPETKDIRRLWERVIFNNLVLRSMSSIKERPNYDDYAEGWSKFIEMALITKCDKCIFYGTDMNKVNALKKYLKKEDCAYSYNKYEKIGNSIPKLLSFIHKGLTIEILFIGHPSRYFSWDKYHSIINRHLGFTI